MSSRFSPRFAAFSLAALAVTLAPPPAQACGGGMFTAPTESETTTMSGHRVAISISPDQTVLWDQIQYQGDPKDFAWVMPVKAGATVGVGSDAWLEALDASTTTVITSSEVQCFNGGDSSPSGGCSGATDRAAGASNDLHEKDPAVEVTHRATVGPYETVTLSSSTPGALGAWLDKNGYTIPADVKPILDDYAAQGLDFLAVRLAPGQGVAQMKPLRVVTPGALTTFPMRMLSAGAKASVALSLFVVTEGRSAIEGYPNATIKSLDLTWDFATHSSNYADVRAKKLAEGSGRTFLTTYAEPRTLLASLPAFESDDRPSVADTLFARALQNKEVSAACAPTYTKLADSTAKVASAPGAGETNPSVFTCDKVDDLAVALTGLHPSDVWVMRFEANLPKGALTTDLTIAPLVADQTPYDSHITAEHSTNDACGAGAPAPLLTSRPRGPQPRDGALAALLLAFGAAFARRLARGARVRSLKDASA